MSITNITPREQELTKRVKELEAVVLGAGVTITGLEREISELKSLVANVHTARGRYHSQIAMARLYEACKLPFVMPVSKEKRK